MYHMDRLAEFGNFLAGWKGKIMRKSIAVGVVLGFLASLGTAAAQTGDVAQTGNATRGERVFAQCKACHTVDKGGRNGIGPNLFGVFGSKAGATAGFAFSNEMKASGIVWDDKTMAEYLKDPKGRIPGTKMVFAGVRRPEQLEDLMAYLKKATQ
jgi:cytochrome c